MHVHIQYRLGKMTGLLNAPEGGYNEVVILFFVCVLFMYIKIKINK